MPRNVKQAPQPCGPVEFATFLAKLRSWVGVRRRMKKKKKKKKKNRGSERKRERRERLALMLPSLLAINDLAVTVKLKCIITA